MIGKGVRERERKERESREKEERVREGEGGERVEKKGESERG